MGKCPHDVLLHHADRHAKLLRDLAMTPTLDLVQNEGGLAGRRKLVQQHGQSYDPLSAMKDVRRILCSGVGVDIHEIDAMKPFGVLLGCKIHSRRARGRENIGSWVFDAHRLRRTSGKAQIGILYDLLAAIAVADETGGISHQIAVMPPEKASEPVVETTCHPSPPEVTDGTESEYSQAPGCSNFLLKDRITSTETITLWQRLAETCVF